MRTEKELETMAGVIMMLLLFIGIVIGISLCIMDKAIVIFIGLGNLGMTLIWIFLVRIYKDMKEEK